MARAARKYIPLTTMDALDNNPGKASLSSIFGRRINRSSRRMFAKKFSRPMASRTGVCRRSQEFLSMLTPEHLPGFNIALNVVISIATIIGFLVIFQSMYTAVLERTREIGILKSMGAGRLAIVSVVLRETMLLAIVGTRWA